MYGMVLMVAVTGSGDTAGFGGKKNNGCDGGVVASAGCSSGGGFLGGRAGGGFLGHKGGNGGNGCMGMQAPMAYYPPAPVYVPAPVYAPACTPVCAPVCAPACAPAPARGGFLSGLCKKKRAPAPCPAPPVPPMPCETHAPAMHAPHTMHGPVPCATALPVGTPPVVIMPVVPNPLPKQ